MTVDVENYVGGVPVVVLATDGTKLYGLLCDTDGRLRVVAGSAGVPADAATETTLNAIKTAAEIIDGGMGLGTETTLDAIKTAAEIIDGFADPTNVLFGCSDRWVEWLGESAPATATYEKLSTAVEEGYVYVLQLVTYTNHSGTRGTAAIEVKDGTNLYRMKRVTNLPQYEPMLWTGELVLKQGDQVYFTQVGVLEDDVLKLGVWGYKMKV